MHLPPAPKVLCKCPAAQELLQKPQATPLSSFTSIYLVTVLLCICLVGILNSTNYYQETKKQLKLAVTPLTKTAFSKPQACTATENVMIVSASCQSTHSNHASRGRECNTHFCSLYS